MAKCWLERPYFDFTASEYYKRKLCDLSGNVRNPLTKVNLIKKYKMTTFDWERRCFKNNYLVAFGK